MLILDLSSLWCSTGLWCWLQGSCVPVRESVLVAGEVADSEEVCKALEGGCVWYTLRLPPPAQVQHPTKTQLAGCSKEGKESLGTA